MEEQMIEPGRPLVGCDPQAPEHPGAGRAFRSGPALRAGLGFCLVLALFAGCASSRLACPWVDHPPAVDGDLAKWQGFLYSFDDDREFVGVKNDGTDLYLCLASDHSDLQRQILRQGLTVWIDPQGGKQKVLGIHFPLGLRDQTGQPGSAPEGPRRRFEPEAAVRALADSGSALEILRGSGPGTRFLLSRTPGLGIKVGWKDEMMIYELRIPLDPDSACPFAVGARPGQTIGVGLETPKLVRGEPAGTDGRRERGSWSDDRSGDRPGGGPDDPTDGDDRPFPSGRRPDMGSPGGSRGGGFEGGRRQTPESLQIWARVVLAKAAAKPGT
jgi:hypothetical protein